MAQYCLDQNWFRALRTTGLKTMIEIHQQKLIVCTTATIPHVGGMSVHVLQFIKEARKQQIGVELISFPRHSKKNIAGGAAGRNGMKVLIVLFIKLVWATLVFFKCFNSKTIAHDPIAAIAASLWKPKELIFVVHGEFTNEINALTGFGKLKPLQNLLRRIEHEAYARSTNIVAVDSRLEKHIRAFSSTRGIETNTAVVWNAVKVPKKYKRANVILGSLPIRIVLSRRLVKKNGVDFALSAINDLVMSGFEIVCDVYGTGTEEAFLKNKFSSNPSIRFHGDVGRSEIFEALLVSDISIIPSIPVGDYVEATSLSALEACALGNLVIASNVGGLGEMLVNNQTALLVKPGSVSQLKNAIQFSLENKKYCIDISNASREWAVNEMSTEKHLKAIMRL